MIQAHEKELKSIKRPDKYPESYFVSKLGFSPYRGCQHGCAYCDGRAERYYVEGVFDKDIDVRVNSADLLDGVLSKQREWGIVGIGSGVSDAYQPLENTYNIMPKIADVLIKHNRPAYIMTKSDLPLRDIQKWKQLNDQVGLTLYVSLTTLSNDIASHFEPGAASPSKRLELIEKFKKEGVGVVVLAMPFLPEITDKPKQVEALMHQLKALNVDAVMPGGLTLRPGRQKDYFLNALGNFDASLVNLYKNIFKENKASGMPQLRYSKERGQIVNRTLSENGLNFCLPHRLYKNRLQLYDEIWVLLTHMVKLYKSRQVDIRNLKKARSRYISWFDKQKDLLFKKRSMVGNDIDSQLLFMMQTGEWKQLLGNDKLADFLVKIALENHVLNYQTLKLESN